MSSPFSNPNQDDLVEPSGAASVPDDPSMENFSFEASATEATKLKEQAQTDQLNPMARPKVPSSPTRKKLATKQDAGRHFADSVAPLSERRLERRQEPSICIVTGINKKERRGMPSWLMSLLLHAVILLLFAFPTLAMRQTNQDDLNWVAHTASYEDVESFQEIEIDLAENFELADADSVSELADPGMAALGDLSAESVLANVSSDVAPISGGLGDLGELLGDSGLSDLGEGLGAAPPASFFGTKIEGKRILYMLDNSGGMKKGKFETLVDELLKSVDSLQPKQQFYVIFYSDTVYPLFYPQSATNFVRATEKNKELLRVWLETVELCLGNSIDEALEAANVIGPDMVFLLTDGKLFTTDAKERMLLDGASREFPISTFGMGVKENSTPAMELQLVAEANRGTYRAIEVSSEAKVIAKQRPRPYHNDRPGAVWGRALAK